MRNYKFTKQEIGTIRICLLIRLSDIHYELEYENVKDNYKIYKEESKNIRKVIDSIAEQEGV